MTDEEIGEMVAMLVASIRKYKETSEHAWQHADRLPDTEDAYAEYARLLKPLRALIGKLTRQILIESVKQP